MERSLPRPAAWLGLAGLLPFIAGALAALAAAPGSPLHATALAALGAYGAVILSFLGAVHWGLALAEPGRPPTVTAARLGLGVVPSLLAWAALLLPPAAGLGLIAAGILATAGIETMASRRGLVPEGYLRLRWLLSPGAAHCLAIGVAMRVP